MNPITIFTDLDDFRSYADGLQADTAYRQLHPSIRATAMEMEKIITKAAFAAIANAQPAADPATPAEPAAEPTAEPATEPAAEPAAEPAQNDGQDPVTSSENLLEGKELLKTALAAGTLYRYQIFASTKRNGSDAALYKYQHEELKDAYLESYWKAMDELLNWLDENPNTGGWKDSADYKSRQKLPIRSAEEFHHYFGINRSSCFYHKVLYLLRDVWKGLSTRIHGFEDNTEVMEATKKVLCYLVIAKVVKTFDLTEFPRSIRFDYNHEYTRGSSTAARDQLYNSLIAEAQLAEAEIEALQRKSVEGDVSGNTNEESDKFYLSI